MSKSINQVFLVGTAGRDPETKFTPSGKAVTNFSMATNRSWKDQSGEWKEETDWHNIVVWGQEKLMGYVLKGSKVAVTGRLQTRSYEDKNGDRKYVTEVVADNVCLMSKSEGQARTAEQGGGFDPSYSDDDTPF